MSPMHIIRRTPALALAALFLLSTASAEALSMSTLEVQATAPARGPIARGAQRVDLLKLMLIASCDIDIPVESVTLHHGGLGDPTDLEGLSLWLGNVRVSPSVRPAARDGEAILRPRRLVIPACASVDLVVRGSLSPDAAVGGEHSFTVESAADFAVSTQSVIVIDPPRGPATPAYTTPSAASDAQVSVTMLPVTGTVTYGAGRTVARLQMRSTGSHTQRVTRLTLTNDGSARDGDLKNLSLRNSRGGQVSGVLAQMTGNKATFDFSEPLVFEGSDTKLFTVRADVRASRKRTIDFTVEDPSDVEAEVCSGARQCARAY